MIVKAIKSFVGKISMNVDEEKEIFDKELAKDLIKAGHVIEIKASKSSAETQQKKEDAAEDTAEKTIDKKPTKNKKKK